MLSPAPSYRICTRCVMDSSDPDITFDDAGLCSHCRRFDKTVREPLQQAMSGKKQEAFARLIADIKERGRGKPYDCVLGLSGGVDSSYLAYIARQQGLRALLVHCDSGWNSELAVQNIEHMTKKLGFDLVTVVLDWEEMRDLQLSFFKASLANCDVPQDHAFAATVYRVADERGIPYILNGGNLATESILPGSWGYNASDLRHLRAVHRRFGSVRLKRFPTLSMWRRYIYYPYLRGIREVRPLNYLPYVKTDAKKILQQELGWRDYGGKHYESVFTKFFQSYYLPIKFGFDKRRAHFASLILSGQMTQDEALAALQEPSYDETAIAADRDYIAKKLGITPAEMQRLFSLPPKTYRDYPSNEALFRLKDKIVATLRNR